MIFKTHQLHEEPVLTGCRKPRLLVSRTDRLLWGTYGGGEKKKKKKQRGGNVITEPTGRETLPTECKKVGPTCLDGLDIRMSLPKGLFQEAAGLSFFCFPPKLFSESISEATNSE